MGCLMRAARWHTTGRNHNNHKRPSATPRRNRAGEQLSSWSFGALTNRPPRTTGRRPTALAVSCLGTAQASCMPGPTSGLLRKDTQADLQLGYAPVGARAAAGVRALVQGPPSPLSLRAAERENQPRTTAPQQAQTVATRGWLKQQQAPAPHVSVLDPPSGRQARAAPTRRRSRSQGNNTCQTHSTSPHYRGGPHMMTKLPSMSSSRDRNACAQVARVHHACAGAPAAASSQALVEAAACGPAKQRTWCCCSGVRGSGKPPWPAPWLHAAA